MQKVREATARTQCGNNLRQLGLATHSCNDTYSKLPPAAGWFPGQQAPGGYGPVQFHLLPLIEQDNLYKSTYNANTGNYMPYDPNNSNNKAHTQVVKTYWCPSDPSDSNGLVTDVGWGASSYA